MSPRLLLIHRRRQVVTGASYGTGRDFALQLAAEGLHVVVTGRSAGKLESLCEEIRQRYSVKCVVLVQDVGKPEWKEAQSRLEGMNISVLVNNVGGGSLDGMTLSYFHTFVREKHEEIMKLNWGSGFGWCYMLLPQMTVLGRGRIYFVSSHSTRWGYFMGTYPAFKSALETLGRIINNEYGDFGIRAETLLMGPVSTPAFNTPADAFGGTVSSEYFVQSALRSFGFYEEYAPTLTHSIMYWFGGVVPIPLRRILLQRASEGIPDIVGAAGRKVEL